MEAVGPLKMGVLMMAYWRLLSVEVDGSTRGGRPLLNSGLVSTHQKGPWLTAPRTLLQIVSGWFHH